MKNRRNKPKRIKSRCLQWDFSLRPGTVLGTIEHISGIKKRAIQGGSFTQPFPDWNHIGGIYLNKRGGRCEYKIKKTTPAIKSEAVDQEVLQQNQANIRYNKKGVYSTPIGPHSPFFNITAQSEPKQGTDQSDYQTNGTVYLPKQQRSHNTDTAGKTACKGGCFCVHGITSFSTIP